MPCTAGVIDRWAALRGGDDVVVDVVPFAVPWLCDEPPPHAASARLTAIASTPTVPRCGDNWNLDASDWAASRKSNLYPQSLRLPP